MKNSEKIPTGSLSNTNQKGLVVFWLCTWCALTIGPSVLFPTSTPHLMPQPPILHVIFPLSTPRRRLRAHGTVLASREGTITSVDDLWSGYLSSRGAGDLACGIQRYGSYFEPPNSGTRNLYFRC